MSGKTNIVERNEYIRGMCVKPNATHRWFHRRQIDNAFM